MTDKRTLLVEIGTEELPPNAVLPMAKALADELAARLETAGLAYGDVEHFATPRRIAAQISAVAVGQEDREVVRRGPAIQAAYNEDGTPTKAAQGFARSCGVDLDQLETLENDKGRWLAFRTIEVGAHTSDLLPAMVNEAAARLPIPRRMRWADLRIEFSRPVHWAVLMFGDDAIQTDLLGVSTGRITYGHRFHDPDAIRLESPQEYAPALYERGHVVASFEQRRDIIIEQVKHLAEELGGEAVLDELLVDEITALVEWPVALSGNFERRYLRLPDPVLMATMKGHQRYFAIKSIHGKLMPHFITVANIESVRPESVREGNERVLRPRLADAEFFYDADQKHPFAQMGAGLSNVIFQTQLGSMADKAARVGRLAGHICVAMGLDTESIKKARRAGLLSKNDLLSQLVGEFPELQGIMGRVYALKAGEDEAVSNAIEEAYLPRFSGDAIARTSLGQALALAEKLDTLVGIFGIGQTPTGERDPYALRRASLGVLRTLIEGELDLDLKLMIKDAVGGYADNILCTGIDSIVFEFIIERLRAYLADQNIPAEVFLSVQARHPRRPLDFVRRAKAVDTFRQLPQAQSLAAANKRIQNILRQVEHDLPNDVDENLFRADAEWDLAAKLVGLRPRVQAMLRGNDYTGALTALSGLRDAVDAFLDNVHVMDENPAIKNNRLALLNNISEMFLATADISKLQA